MSARAALLFHLDMSTEGMEALLDAYCAEVQRETLRRAAAKIRAVRVTLEVKGDDVPGVLADLIDPDKT